MMEACEKFLVSDELGFAAELGASIQEVIAEATEQASPSPLYVKRLLSRTTAPHGLTAAEVKRVFGATHYMAKQRRQVWFATLGDGLQDMSAGEARDLADVFLKKVVTEQKNKGLPQHWIQVWECSGGLHCHIVFVGNRSLVERLRASGRFAQYLHVRWAYDTLGLPVYLSKERTPQTQYGLGPFIGGARKLGSHRLPGGGDRVRLSSALKKEAVEVGYVEPWRQTNAKRSTVRKAPKPYQIRRGKAPKLAGQILLFTEMGKVSARLKDFHGGHMSPAQAQETEFRRERSGLSQHMLAQLAGVSQPHYANVVRGHDSMSRRAARRLKEALVPQQKAA